MPTYRVTDPQTGLTLEIQGDRQPTKGELRRLFDREALKQQRNSRPAPVETAQPSTTEKAVGVGETAASILSGMLAEPISGLAGIAAAAIPGGRTGAEAVQATQEALTYQPRTEQGQRYTQGVGGLFEPVGEALQGAEDYLGNAAFEATGSPAVAAAATAVPTAIMEVLGLGAGKSVKRLSRRSQIEDVALAATPSEDSLRTVARGIWDEIDELGFAVEPTQFSGFVDDLTQGLVKDGLDVADISISNTPKAARVVQRMERAVEKATTEGLPLSELETLRKSAQGVARSIDETEAALGSQMVRRIDEFIEQSDANLVVPKTLKAIGVDVGQRYRVARDLWGRAKRSQMINDAMRRAGRSKSGFTTAMQGEIRKILNGKKSRFFTDDELSMLEDFISDPKERMAMLIGQYGFTPGGGAYVPLIAAGAGYGAGFAVGGPVGGAIGAGLVGITTMSARKVADIMAKRGINFVDQMVRRGKDGKAVVEYYMRAVPKNSRNMDELAELLMHTDRHNIPRDTQLIRAAIRRSEDLEAGLATAAVVGSAVQQENAPTLTSQQASALMEGGDRAKARAYERLMGAGQLPRLEEANPGVYQELLRAYEALNP